MAPRVLTGGTGFIGRHLLAELVKREGDVLVLVRPGSIERLEALVADIPGAAGKVKELPGDITRPGLGIKAGDLGHLKGAEVFHLAAVYDLEASEEENQLANVVGTANVVGFANQIASSRLHHTSSIAVAGHHWQGEFTEDMFDAGQRLDHPYYRTKFEAERMVRELAAVPRPSPPKRRPRWFWSRC